MKKINVNKVYIKRPVGINRLIEILRERGDLDEEKLKKFRKLQSRHRKNTILAILAFCLVGYTNNNKTVAILGIIGGVIFLFSLARFGYLYKLIAYNQFLKIESNITRIQKCRLFGSRGVMKLLKSWSINHEYEITGNKYEIFGDEVVRGKGKDPEFIGDDKVSVLVDADNPYQHLIYTSEDNNKFNLKKDKE